MKIKIDRIISIATLVASLVAIFLVLKRPAPVAQRQSAAAIAANAQSFEQKMGQLDQAAQSKASAWPAAQPNSTPAPTQYSQADADWLAEKFTTDRRFGAKAKMKTKRSAR